MVRPNVQRALHIALAALVVAALHFALVAWYRDVVMAGGIAERTLAEFEAARASVRVVALGDSHVKWGIDAEAIPGAFNFALPGETLALSYYRLRSLLDDERLPLEAVVLAADPHSFERKRRPDQPFLHYYAGFADLAEIGAAEGEPLYGLVEQLRGRFAPYAGQRANVLAYLATGGPPEARWLASVPMRAGGLVSERRLTQFSAEGRRAVADERLRVHFAPEPGIDPVLADYLERLLALCDERGVRALLVRFPLSDEYLAALRDVADTAAVDARFEASAARSASAELLDARHAFAGQPELFADVDHLNREGAERLSRLVALRLAR